VTDDGTSDMTGEVPSPPDGGGDGVRVVLVDDHRMFRTGVRAELGPAVTVVGEADDVPSALAVVRATVPEVVLLDVHLPGGGGRAVLEQLVPQLPDVRFLAPVGVRRCRRRHRCDPGRCAWLRHQDHHR
jgi:CheY-like chemotaxis protein